MFHAHAFDVMEYIISLLAIYKSHMWTPSNANREIGYIFAVLYVASVSMHMPSPLMNDLENYMKNLKYDTNYVQWETHGTYFTPL